MSSFTTDHPHPQLARDRRDACQLLVEQADTDGDFLILFASPRMIRAACAKFGPDRVIVHDMVFVDGDVSRRRALEQMAKEIGFKAAPSGDPLGLIESLPPGSVVAGVHCLYFWGRDDWRRALLAVEARRLKFFTVSLFPQSVMGELPDSSFYVLEQRRRNGGPLPEVWVKEHVRGNLTGYEHPLKQIFCTGSMPLGFVSRSDETLQFSVFAEVLGRADDDTALARLTPRVGGIPVPIRAGVAKDGRIIATPQRYEFRWTAQRLLHWVTGSSLHEQPEPLYHVDDLALAHHEIGRFRKATDEYQHAHLYTFFARRYPAMPSAIMARYCSGLLQRVRSEPPSFSAFEVTVGELISVAERLFGWGDPLPEANPPEPPPPPPPRDLPVACCVLKAGIYENPDLPLTCAASPWVGNLWSKSGGPTAVTRSIGCVHNFRYGVLMRCTERPVPKADHYLGHLDYNPLNESFAWPKNMLPVRSDPDNEELVARLLAMSPEQLLQKFPRPKRARYLRACEKVGGWDFFCADALHSVRRFVLPQGSVTRLVLATCQSDEKYSDECAKLGLLVRGAEALVKSNELMFPKSLKEKPEIRPRIIVMGPPTVTLGYLGASLATSKLLASLFDGREAFRRRGPRGESTLCPVYCPGLNLGQIAEVAGRYPGYYWLGADLKTCDITFHGPEKSRVGWFLTELLRRCNQNVPDDLVYRWVFYTLARTRVSFLDRANQYTDYVELPDMMFSGEEITSLFTSVMSVLTVEKALDRVDWPGDCVAFVMGDDLLLGFEIPPTPEVVVQIEDYYTDVGKMIEFESRTAGPLPDAAFLSCRFVPNALGGITVLPIYGRAWFKLFHSATRFRSAPGRLKSKLLSYRAPFRSLPFFGVLIEGLLLALVDVRPEQSVDEEFRPCHPRYGYTPPRPCRAVLAWFEAHYGITPADADAEAERLVRDYVARRPLFSEVARQFCRVDGYDY